MSLQATDFPIKTPPSKLTRQNRWLMLVLRLLWFLISLVTVRNLVVSVVVTVFAGLLVVFIGYFAQLVFTKPQQVVEGSFAHTYFIDTFVKDMPAFKPLENSVKYFFNFINSDSVPAYIVRYESHAPAEEIISYYQVYFEILNYTQIKHPFDSNAIAMFHNTKEGFTVFVSEGEGVNTVFIENYKY